MSDLINWLAGWWQQLVNFLEGLPLHIYTAMLSGLATVINWIPAPSFFGDLSGWIGSIPPLVAFLLGALQIGTLVTILVSAFTVRFLIRRIFFIN
jgi:hypothetical protein